MPTWRPALFGRLGTCKQAGFAIWMVPCRCRRRRKSRPSKKIVETGKESRGPSSWVRLFHPLIPEQSPFFVQEVLIVWQDVLPDRGAPNLTTVEGSIASKHLGAVKMSRKRKPNRNIAFSLVHSMSIVNMRPRLYLRLCQLAECIVFLAFFWGTQQLISEGHFCLRRGHPKRGHIIDTVTPTSVYCPTYIPPKWAYPQICPETNGCKQYSDCTGAVLGRQQTKSPVVWLVSWRVCSFRTWICGTGHGSFHGLGTAPPRLEDPSTNGLIS